MIKLMNCDFRKTNGIWETKILLEEWSTFFGYPIEVDVNLGGDSKVETVQDKHLRAYQYLKNNQKQLLKNILEKLFFEYKNLQESYGYDDEEKSEYMLGIYSIEDLKDLIKLKRVHILNVEKNNLSYIGFHFECKWDDEQELGFMTHETKVVKMGSSDSSFLSWIAEEDCKKTGEGKIIIPKEFKSIDTPKTVYDPNIISDEQI